MFNPIPSEAAIQAVMRQFGFDYIQARNHVIGRMILQERLQSVYNSERAL